MQIHHPRVRRLIRDDRTGSILMLAAAVAALIVANSAGQSWYRALSSAHFGPAVLDLQLSTNHWVTDGLLAIFFFVIGLELKHELTHGSLRNVRAAALPVIAAVGGVVTPAVIYLILSASFARDVIHGWAIPTATDIAFVVAMFALVGRGLPSGLRTFLLTLAVADDLIAIVIIAIWYSGPLNWVALSLAAASIVGYALLARSRRAPIIFLVALGLVAWAAIHASGVHATLAGAALGLVTPATPIGNEPQSRAVRWGHWISPWSSLVVLPIFAFFATGVTLGGPDVQLDDAVWIIAAALVIGKLVGISFFTYGAHRWLNLVLPRHVHMADVIAAAPLAGVGFTISLLLASLTFTDAGHLASGKLGILVGSCVAVVIGTLTLAARRRALTRLSATNQR